MLDFSLLFLSAASIKKIVAACERYYALQDEVRSVEQLRKGAENIMREGVQERQPRRVQDIDLWTGRAAG